jgi:hypothetical protein
VRDAARGHEQRERIVHDGRSERERRRAARGLSDELRTAQEHDVVRRRVRSARRTAEIRSKRYAFGRAEDGRRNGSADVDRDAVPMLAVGRRHGDARTNDTRAVHDSIRAHASEYVGLARRGANGGRTTRGEISDDRAA